MGDDAGDDAPAVDDDERVPEEWVEAIALLRRPRDGGELDFGRSALGDSGTSALALLLTHIPGALCDVRKLLLDKCQLSSTGIAAFAAALAAGALPRLDQLGMAGNTIGDDGLGHLAGALAAGALSHLRELSLESTGIGDVGIERLCAALVPSARPGALPVAGGPKQSAVGDGACSAPRLAALKELDLSDNDIGDPGCSYLAAAIEHGALASLNELRLGSNELGDAALTALAASLKHLRKLSELALDNNWVGDAGVVQLAAAIRQDGALQSLHVLALDDNMISGEGIAAFARAAEPDDALPMLEALDLDGNHIDADAFDEMARVIGRGGLPALKILEIDDIYLDHAALKGACTERHVTLR